MEWNGRSLRGLTFEDVYDIIFESKSDPQVELKVERPVSRTDLNAGMSEQLEIEGFRYSDILQFVSFYSKCSDSYRCYKVSYTLKPELV